MSNVFPSSPLDLMSTAMADAVSAAAPGVLAIQTRHARASGFVWRPGWLVSSEEGLPEDEEAELVLPGGATVAAKVAGRDPTTDVLLLRCEGVTAPPVVFDAAPLRAGEMVLALGAREGLPLVAGGLVSLAGPAWRSLRGGEIDARIELDLRLRLGAEGASCSTRRARLRAWRCSVRDGACCSFPRPRSSALPRSSCRTAACRAATSG